MVSNLFKKFFRYSFPFFCFLLILPLFSVAADERDDLYRKYTWPLSYKDNNSVQLAEGFTKLGNYKDSKQLAAIFEAASREDFSVLGRLCTEYFKAERPAIQGSILLRFLKDELEDKHKNDNRENFSALYLSSFGQVHKAILLYGLKYDRWDFQNSGYMNSYISQDGFSYTLFGYATIEEVLKQCGTDPKGKLLVYSRRAPEKTGNPEKAEINFSTMALMPEDLYPQRLSEVEYLLEFFYGDYKTVATYTDKSKGIQVNGKITLTRIRDKKVLFSVSMTGGSPPYSKSGSGDAYGKNPSEQERAKAFADCIVMLSGKKSGDYGYVLDNSGVVILTYAGQKDNVVIPSNLDNYPVTVIGSSAFSESDSPFEKPRLVSVSLPGSVRKISSYAFSNCRSLKEVKFTEGLEEIGASAFFGCITLESVVLPKGLVSLGAYAFNDCGKLKNAWVPDSVKVFSKTEEVFRLNHADFTVHCTRSAPYYEMVGKFNLKWTEK